MTFASKYQLRICRADDDSMLVVYYNLTALTVVFCFAGMVQATIADGSVRHKNIIESPAFGVRHCCWLWAADSCGTAMLCPRVAIDQKTIINAWYEIEA